MEKLDKNTHILIVGMGLMGGSYAKALAPKGYEIHAITRNQKSIDFAIYSNLITKGSVEVKEEDVAWADLIIFALYPHAFVEWIEEHGHLIKPGTIITDVTGVKRVIVDKIQSIIPDGVEYIAAHPMAGRERSGIVYSDNSVFAGANYIVVPTDKNTITAINVCKKLGEELGFYRISMLDPETHDTMIAFLSQLAHCIAVALMCEDTIPGLEKYTGDSFRDLTRIARINDEMWSELFLLNKDTLLDAMNKFEEQFDKLKQTLENDDREGMREMMRLASDRRDKFDKPSEE